MPHSDELPQPDVDDLSSDDILQESFHSLMPVQIGENSSDSDDTVNVTDFDEMLVIRSTTSLAQPEYFDLIDLTLGLGLSKN